MKGLLVSTVACVLFVCVQSENCTVVSDCSVTGCSGGANLVCDGGRCTCTLSCGSENALAKCKTQQDCVDSYNNFEFQCECEPVTQLHCIDNICYCGYPPNRNNWFNFNI